MKNWGYPLVNCHITNWKITMLLIGKLTISMVIFNSYVTNYQRVNDGTLRFNQLMVSKLLWKSNEKRPTTIDLSCHDPTGSTHAAAFFGQQLLDRMFSFGQPHFVQIDTKKTGTSATNTVSSSHVPICLMGMSMSFQPAWGIYVLYCSNSNLLF